MEITKAVPGPFAIQIEAVEGCSLACSFCGIQDIRNNGADGELGIHGKNSAPYRYMDVETVDVIAKGAKKAGWNPRFEFAMHGEPTIHPKLALMIGHVRQQFPNGYIMVTSNGSGLLKDTVNKINYMFSLGLSTLAIDDYKHSGGWVQQIKDSIEADVFGLRKDIEVMHYPRNLKANPHQRYPKKRLVFINDISDNETGVHQLTNQGGSAFAKVETLDERCAKPFRELSVRWDGNVAICCDDWPGKFKIGNILEMGVEDVWYHPRMEAARRHLYARDRAFGPCMGCNVRTTRNGLLPDKLGKEEMPEPDEESRALLKEALRGKVFTIKPV